MQGNRRLWVILGLILVLVLAVGGFFLWLSGGSPGSNNTKAPPAQGFTHVRSIYLYDGAKALSKPVGLGSDASGNFFVTLRDATVVVEFDKQGDYVAHWGTKGQDPGNMLAPLGVAVDRARGHIYVADRARLRVICFDTEGRYLWEQPVLNPTSVAVDENGEILVTTFGPIVRYTSEGQFVSELGIRGSGPLQFDFPRQAATEAGGVLYVADSNNARVQNVVFPENTESTPTAEWVVGAPPEGAEAPRGMFVNPTGIAVSPNGLLVVLDGFQHIVRMLDPADGAELTDFGGERRGQADGTFEFPTQVTHLSGDLYAVADTYNDRVQIIRLVEPGTLNPLRRFPWLIWLLPLLLLPLLWQLGRKRAFITRETLQRALDEGNVRLLIGIYRKLHVLPEVAQQFEEKTEEGVRIGDYLEAVEYKAPPQKKPKPGEPEPAPPRALADMTPEERLAGAAERSRLETLLLARHSVLCVDDGQVGVFTDLGCKATAYEVVVDEYSLPEKKAKPTS